MRNLSKF